MMDNDERRTDDHGRERDEQGRDTDWQRHQSPPRFYAGARAHATGPAAHVPRTPAGGLLRA